MPRARRQLHPEGGTTLIESMVAVGLFLVAAAAISSLLVGHIRYQGMNTIRTTAITLAARELENLRGLDYKDIASHTTTQSIDGRTYTIVTTVQDNTPAANMKTIEASIGWTESSGAQTYAISAIYTAIKR